MHSQQSISQKRSWSDTRTRLFSFLHQITPSVNPSAMGPPFLHWLGYMLVMLQPLHCCLLPYALSFLSPCVFCHCCLVLSYCFSFSWHLVLLICVYGIRARCASLPRFTLLCWTHWLFTPFCLISCKFMLNGPIGPLPYSFLLGFYLVLHGYFPSLGPCLGHIWLLSRPLGLSPIAVFFPLLSPFFGLVWAFTAIGPLGPYYQKWVSTLGIKLDMQKTYDTIYGFLLEVLRKLGFDCKFVRLMEQCISMVTFTLVLRQGNPLTPYLFVIVSEVLSRLLLAKEAKWELKGIR